MMMKKRGAMRITVLCGALVSVLFLSVSCVNYVYDMGRQGDDALVAGNLSEALADYTKAINLNPKDVQAYLGRGYVYQRMGQYDKALVDYNKAVELAPKDAGVYLTRGLAYSVAGKNESAVEDYSRALQIDPMNGDAYYQRGISYGAMGQAERSIEDIRSAARLGNTDARNVLGSRGISW